MLRMGFVEDVEYILGNKRILCKVFVCCLLPSAKQDKIYLLLDIFWAMALTFCSMVDECCDDIVLSCNEV